MQVEFNTALRVEVQYDEALFSEGQGFIQGFKVKIYTSLNRTPIFFKACPDTHAMKEAVEKTWTDWRTKGDWAAPIVTMPKSDQINRTCDDYKVRVNTLTMDHLRFATTARGISFSKLDLSHAYPQVDKQSEKYLTTNMHKGLCKYHCLSYGIPVLLQWFSMS